MPWRTGILVLSFFALVGVIQYPRVMEFVRYSVATERKIEVPLPGIAAQSPGQFSNEVQINTRVVPESQLTIGDLKLMELEYINTDRALHGLAPVTMGNNPAAQQHAEDMVSGRYLGHWWLDGRKPYMVYTETGGDSYVSENAARTGFTDTEYADLCKGISVRCEKVNPVDDIKRLHNAMVYDDASSNWGHRDNILNPGHRQVNIGIAYTDQFLALVQHFEGGDLTSTRTPSLTGTTLRLRADINVPGLRVFPTVNVFREPFPEPHTATEIEQFTSYCVGGGFSENCGTQVARVIPPPPSGSRYVNLPGNVVIARSWVISGDDIQIVADLGELAAEPGVYTTALYADTGNSVSGSLLLQLTVTQE